MHVEHPGDSKWVATPSRSRVLADGVETEGKMAVIELSLESGDSSPRHVHTREDQIIYVLEGRLTVIVDEARQEMNAGTCLWLHRERDFSFQVLSAAARLLLVAMPAGIEGYYRELDPIDTSDPGHLVTTAARYGITITGPGPADLATDTGTVTATP